MKRRGSSKILVVIILGVILIPVVYAGLQFYSLDSAETSIINPRIDIGITDLLNIQNTLMDIILSRELDGEFDFLIEGKGILPTQVKSFQAQVFLEDIYVGSFVNNNFFTIPASGSETTHMDFKIDLNEISLSDVELVVESIIEHNGEVQISIEALMEPVIIVFPITVPVTKTKHILTYSDAPEVSSLNWATSGSVVGDQATFSGTVTNVFRDSTVSGNLNIVVREDVSWGSDNTVDVVSIPIQLEPGESVTFSDDFTTFKSESTNGFFLRAEWGTSIIEEQSSSYPPRLKVIEGTLLVDDVYWTVSTVRTTSCEVGDLVEAHIRLSADNAALDDDITVKIKRDIALLPDTNVASESYRIVLDRNQETEIVIEFSPSEASGLSIRGYFVEVEGDVDWTMNDDYPPRLSVNEEQQGSPVVVNAWWTTSSGVVSSVTHGEQVMGHILFEASGGDVNSQLLIHVRKDLALQSDQDLETFSGTLSLLEGQQKEITFSYDASDSPGSSFRGYFLQVDYISIGETWTMDNSYPPRLIVTEVVEEPEQPSTPETPDEPEQPREGTPSIVDVWWTVNDQIVTSCQQDQTVIANVKIMANGGPVSGTITVHVRKDIPYLPDEDHVTQSFSVSLSEGHSGVATVTFIATHKTGWTFRGYFIQVDLDLWDTTWTMENTYPPRLTIN